MPLAVNIADELREALSFAFGMFWEVLWALILGFFLSAVVQAVVSKQEMRRLLPDEPCWLRQVHGTVAVDVGKVAEMTAADAACTLSAR